MGEREGGGKMERVKQLSGGKPSEGFDPYVQD